MVIPIGISAVDSSKTYGSQPACPVLMGKLTLRASGRGGQLCAVTRHSGVSDDDSEADLSLARHAGKDR
jgi:hypothetical protein